MNLEQITADSNFAIFGREAVYNDGGEDIPCRVIREQGIDQFAEERLGVPRVELLLLVSEIGEHSPGATVTLAGTEFEVRHLLEDDGVVRRVLVEY